MLRNYKCCFTCKNCFGVVGGSYQCAVKKEETFPESYCYAYEAERPELEGAEVFPQED